MKEQPNYYAILTADVRYSKQINANEKLLYAEITALTHKEGYCWASNDYFAELYSCTPQAISKWIKNLKDNGFISCNYIYKEGSKEIQKRVIRLSSIGINNGLTGINNDTIGINIELKGYQHTIKDNNTSYNNINNNSLVGSSQTPTKKDSKKDLFKTKLSEVDVTTLDKQEQVYFKIAIGFRDLFIKNKKALGVNDFRDQENATYKNYVDPIRLSFTQDKKTEEDFRKVYAFLMNDEFWMKNIMSTSKLREKMSDLLIRSSSVPTKKQVLPSDFWVRELSDEQKKLLSDKDLATWERQKTARLMEGGRMLPIKIEYEK
jgi:hypothetical protein